MSYGKELLDDSMYERMQCQEYYDHLEDLASKGIWMSKSGAIKISDMATSHIENCLEFIKGTSKEEIYTQLFIDELNYRVDKRFKEEEIDIE